MKQPKASVLHYYNTSRILYGKLLQHAGFAVTEHPTQTPEQVIALLMQERPNVAIISVAFGSPSQEPDKKTMGLDTLAQIRQNPELSTLPVIMESSSDDYRHEALAAGANYYHVGGLNSNKVLIQKVKEIVGD